MKIEVEIGELCPVCQCRVRVGIALPETHVPGLEIDGNPLRIVVYHNECAPKFAHDYHDRLRKTGSVR